MTTSTSCSELNLFTHQGMGVVTMVMLARFAVIEVSGAMSLSSLVHSIGALFVNACHSSAMNEKQDTRYIDESRAFWFNI